MELYQISYHRNGGGPQRGFYVILFMDRGAPHSKTKPYNFMATYFSKEDISVINTHILSEFNSVIFMVNSWGANHFADNIARWIEEYRANL